MERIIAELNKTEKQCTKFQARARPIKKNNATKPPLHWNPLESSLPPIQPTVDVAGPLVCPRNACTTLVQILSQSNLSFKMQYYKIIIKKYSQHHSSRLLSMLRRIHLAYKLNIYDRVELLCYCFQSTLSIFFT